MVGRKDSISGFILVPNVNDLAVEHTAGCAGIGEDVIQGKGTLPLPPNSKPQKLTSTTQGLGRRRRVPNGVVYSAPRKNVAKLGVEVSMSVRADVEITQQDTFGFQKRLVGVEETARRERGGHIAELAPPLELSFKITS